MRYWFDTEFVERGPRHPVELVSIGIVAEDGRELYAQVWDGLSAAINHDWVRENVVPHLTHMTLAIEKPATAKRRPVLNLRTCDHDSLAVHPDCPWRSLETLAGDIRAFCDPETYGKPEFWAYYADYDWVVLCQVFGTMIDLPKGWPMYCRDLKQLAVMLGNPKLPEQGKGEHHALADARWNREAHSFLIGYGQAAGFPETMLAA